MLGNHPPPFTDRLLDFAGRLELRLKLVFGGDARFQLNFAGANHGSGRRAIQDSPLSRIRRVKRVEFIIDQDKIFSVELSILPVAKLSPEFIYVLCRKSVAEQSLDSSGKHFVINVGNILPVGEKQECLLLRREVQLQGVL